MKTFKEQLAEKVREDQEKSRKKFNEDLIKENEKNAIQLLRESVNKKEKTPRGSTLWRNCSNLERASDIFVLKYFELQGNLIEKVFDLQRQKQGIDYIINGNEKIDCKIQSPTLRKHWRSNLEIMVNAEVVQSKNNIGWALDPTHITDTVLYICPDFDCPPDEMIIDFVEIDFPQLKAFVKQLEELEEANWRIASKKKPVKNSDAWNWIIPLMELRFVNFSINYRIENEKLIATHNLERTKRIRNVN